MQNTFSAEENFAYKMHGLAEAFAGNFAPTVGDMVVLNKITNDYKNSKATKAHCYPLVCRKCII